MEEIQLADNGGAKKNDPKAPLSTPAYRKEKLKVVVNVDNPLGGRDTKNAYIDQ